jgi:hypothetical protein
MTDSKLTDGLELAKASYRDVWRFERSASRTTTQEIIRAVAYYEDILKRGGVAFVSPDFRA